MKARSQKFIQQRKFLMMLPLLVTPFITMIFWALGGGKGIPAQAAVAADHLNVSLPDAHFGKREVWDKLSLYEIAERDSARFDEARKSDPYFDLITFETQQVRNDTAKEEQDNLIMAFPGKQKRITDTNEERVNRKLEELYREINKPAAATEARQHNSITAVTTDPQFTEDVNRLASMMEVVNEPGQPDPEMQQIENVLEKLLDVQHPERVKERLRLSEEERSEDIYTVNRATDADDISLLKSRRSIAEMDTAAFLQALGTTSSLSNGFFGLDEDTTDPTEGNAIEAVIHNTQQLVAGSTVRIRMVDPVEINGRVIPKDRFMYGVCTINGERLQIAVNSIRTENTLLPVSLTVFDLDGLEGIYIPGAIVRDAAKQASDNALQSMQLMSVDPSISAQATMAGVEAAKGMLSKKAKLVKVTVKAGYKILLRDMNPAVSY